LLVCGNLAMAVTILGDVPAADASAPLAAPGQPAREGQLIKTSGFHQRPARPAGEAGAHIPTSGGYVRVQATAQRSWEQAVESVVLHSNQRLTQGQHFLALLRAGYHLTHVAS